VLQTRERGRIHRSSRKADMLSLISYDTVEESNT